MSISTYSSSILAGLITSNLPIQDQNIRFTTGLLINETFQTLSKALINFDFFRWIRWNTSNQIIISETVNERYYSVYNHIYYKIEEYLLKKSLDKMEVCELVPQKGDYKFSIGSEVPRYDILEKFVDNEGKEHNAYFRFEFQQGSSTTDKPLPGTKKIVIRSKTASFDSLKNFCHDLVLKLDQAKSDTLKIHRTMISSKKDAEPYWDSLNIKTNKNKSNTILSKKIKEELFTDLENFLQKEDWYAEKGLPYRRGYILWGPPGCGKSSVIKSIANSYNLDIFSLELASIKSNSQLISVFSEITYMARNRKYLLSIEDAEKSNFFKDNSVKKVNSPYSAWLPKKDEPEGITVDCLINCLDGIVESYGQIVIITANDVAPILGVSALVRPGRIDKVLNVTYCDNEQIIGLLNKFYDQVEFSFEEDRIVKKEITPATLIKWMQRNPECPDDVIKILYGEKSEDPDKQLTYPDTDKQMIVDKSIPKRRNPIQMLEAKKKEKENISGILNKFNKKRKRASKLQTNTDKYVKNLQDRMKKINQDIDQREAKLKTISKSSKKQRR